MNTVKIEKGNVKMVAHRGVSGLERENTCPAFVAAGNRSYFGVETDVHVTKDKKFVIIHDETTDRVSGGTVCMNVETNYLCATEGVILPDLDGSRDRTDIRIPTLCEYVKICKKYEKKCVLEIKNPFEEADLAALIEEIKNIGYLENIIFISFALSNCIIIRNMLPEAEVQFLTSGEVTDELIATLLENKLDLDIYYKRLNAENIALLHTKGIKVNCWTVDNPEDGEALVKAGVDFITTNILE
jgi:glycerophosphoryl diester phosphodiesterase